MKRNKSTELLLIQKAVKENLSFEKNVDDLLALIGKLDNASLGQQTAEEIDFYNKKHTPLRKLKKKKEFTESRPFQFLIYCN